MPRRKLRGQVVAVERVMGDSTLLTLASLSKLVTEIQPGQFVGVRCWDASSDREVWRPYSIFSADARDGTIRLLVRPFGRCSSWLAARQRGTMLHVVGPIGDGFEVAARARNLLLVAGGVGAAPLVLLAERAISAERRIVYLMGAASEAGLLPRLLLPPQVHYVVTTEDGGRGHRGFVTDLVGEWSPWADQIFACGPELMIHALREVVSMAGSRNPARVQVAWSVAPTRSPGMPDTPTKQGLPSWCSPIRGPVFDLAEIP